VGEEKKETVDNGIYVLALGFLVIVLYFLWNCKSLSDLYLVGTGLIFVLFLIIILYHEDKK
jgi:hypothetical protein